MRCQVMKKSIVRVVVIAAILVAFVAIFVMVAARGPVFGPDIALVRGVRPFSYEVKSFKPGGPLYIERAYVLRKPYKQAVLDVSKELDNAHWIQWHSLQEATFFRLFNTNESVQIERRLRLSGIRKPTGRWFDDNGRIIAENANPDPRGWILVVTQRPLHGWPLALTRLRRMVGGRMKNWPVEYTDLIPQLAGPRNESSNAPDVESTECEVTWVSAEPVHLPTNP